MSNNWYTCIEHYCRFIHIAWVNMLTKKCELKSSDRYFGQQILAFIVSSARLWIVFVQTPVEGNGKRPFRERSRGREGGVVVGISCYCDIHFYRGIKWISDSDSDSNSDMYQIVPGTWGAPFIHYPWQWKSLIYSLWFTSVTTNISV